MGSQEALGFKGRVEVQNTYLFTISSLLTPFVLPSQSIVRGTGCLLPHRFPEIGKFSSIFAYVQLVKQCVISIIIVRYDYTMMYQKFRAAIPREAECYILQIG